MPRLTRKAIAAQIKKETGWDVVLEPGNGYFWFTSDDDATALKLAGFYTTTVDVFQLNDLSLERWVEEFKGMLDEYERNHGFRLL